MKPREMNIRPVLNGYIVEVGCQTVVFHNTKKLLKELKRYLKDPVKVEEEYFKDRAGAIAVADWGLSYTNNENGAYFRMGNLGNVNPTTVPDPHFQMGNHYNIMHEDEILHGGIFMTDDQRLRFEAFVRNIGWDWRLEAVQLADDSEIQELREALRRQELEHGEHPRSDES